MEQQSVSIKRQLTPCPRCIGGKLVRDYDQEQVCVNCGWYPRPEPLPSTGGHGPVLIGSRCHGR